MRANSNDSESQEDKMKRMSDYMICTHFDWEEGQPYEKRLYPTGGPISFNCYYKQITKPEVSLEKMEGKVSYSLVSNNSTAGNKSTATENL